MAISFTNRPTNSTDSRTSRYVQGGNTDRYSTRLGWWERQNIERKNTDILYTIQTFEDKRPDLVAKSVYGQVALTWLVLQYNNIVDVEVEFVAGKQLVLPSPNRVNTDILNKSTGGNPI